MPSDYGRGLDDDQGGRPAGPEPGQPGPEDSVAFTEFRAFDGALQSQQLLAKGDILGGKGRSAGEERPEERQEHP